MSAVLKQYRHAVQNVGGGGAATLRARGVESCYASCSLHLEEGESWYAFNVSVRHNWKAFKTWKNNRKKAGPFSVGTEAAVSDR